MFNQVPLDLSKLLIKRRNKDSNEFIVLYHNAQEMGEVASPQIMSLYSDLQTAEPAVLQQKRLALSSESTISNVKQYNEVNEYLRR